MTDGRQAMREITVSLDELRAMAPSCGSVQKIRPAFRDRERLGAADAVAAGATLDDLVWVAAALARCDPDVHRRLVLWAADCAARALPVFEARFRDDPRPRDAIMAARKTARDDQDAAIASVAARAAANAACAAWAGDAAYAAAATYAAAAAACHFGAYRAALAADAFRPDIRQWQTDRFVARMSADEPEDWPLEPRQ